MSMCNECCREFKGWCRAFTATEIILSFLQAILLALLIGFLTFLILHFVVCSGNASDITQPDVLTTESLSPVEWSADRDATATPAEVTRSSPFVDNNTMWSPVPSHVACTWTPSEKSRSVHRHTEPAREPFDTSNVTTRLKVTPPLYNKLVQKEEHGYNILAEHSDGEPANDEKSLVLALIKMRPPDDITFGCILTIISKFWTLTAASCIESIEEVDSLDSFVMMESFGESRHGKSHPVSDVLIHPRYRGTNKIYDIVALKSEDELTNGDMLLKLPTALDYLLITIGERLTILGFGKFRSIDRDAFARGAHAVSVHVLPSAQCVSRQDAWSARHLAGGAPAARGRCGAAQLCAGPLRARAAPCNYCAGTPLLQARVLLGLMSDPGPCGAPCEPALYVNLAASLDWLHTVVGDN